MPESVNIKKMASEAGYPVNAFAFVQRGLDFTIKREHGDVGNIAKLSPSELKQRHIGGGILCYGLRDYALEQYGLLARFVLGRWGINDCQDFGKIVFAMIENGLMSKTEADKPEDFLNVFDFADDFPSPITTSHKA